MMEWKKVLRQKKILAVLAALFVFQIFFFLYSMQEKMALETYEDTQKYEKEEQEAYIAGYHASVEEKVNQADSMNVISIFAQEDSFSSRNVERTKKDFEGLLSVQPVFFDDTFLKEFFSFSTLNTIAVLCAMAVAFALVDENRRGLQQMIYSSAGGRGKLVLEKIAAMLLWAFLITVFLYGGTLAASAFLFHGNLAECLNYPLQSLSMFSSLPWHLGIGEFLLVYLCYRFVILFLVMLVVWTLLFVFGNLLLAAGAAAVIGILSYLSYRLVDASSPVNILRYCSPWYLVMTNGFFTDYKNLNLFSYAVNKNSAVLAELLLVFLLVSGTAVLVGHCRRPCTETVGRLRKKIEKLGRKAGLLTARFQERLSLSGAEYYKVLVSQRGIVVILVILAAFVYRTDFTSVQLSGKQEMYRDFLEEHMGIPDKKSNEAIDTVEQELQQVDDALAEAFRKNQNGELPDWDLIEMRMRYEGYEQEREYLQLIQEQTGYLEGLKKEQNIDGWYVNVYSYNHLLQDEAGLSNLFLVFGIVLLCSGIFSTEDKHGMRPAMRGSVNGRTVIFRKKIQAVFVLAFVLFLVTAALEIGSVARVYGLKGLAAPVQSLMSLSFVPVKCSIGVFLALLYLMKAVMLFAVSAFTCMVSARTTQKFTIGAALVLCIPELLVMAGFGFFKYVSIVEVLSVVPFMYQTKNMAVTAAAFVFLLLGIWSVRTGYKKWCIS